MLGFIKVSEMCSLAIHSMILLAHKSDSKILTIQNIASDLKVSEAHLAKVLQKLAKVGLVQSVRGPKGGFLLARSTNEISFQQIYEAIEGPLVAKSVCLLKRDICPYNSCPLNNSITKCFEIFMNDFFRKTLADVIRD